MAFVGCVASEVVARFGLGKVLVVRIRFRLVDPLFCYALVLSLRKRALAQLYGRLTIRARSKVIDLPFMLCLSPARYVGIV